MRQFVLGTAPPPVSGAPVWSIERVSRAFSDAFEITRPLDRERATHWLWLVGIAGLGAILRLWGLGSVGLHGDEETMAMAVRHILLDGAPILPSGMFYPRGLTQLYLMAASVSVFGESEWALRLPSALCGVALIPLSYIASRRFLRPVWGLAFSASVALLPDLILDSQTARMYIFLVACVTTCMSCLFAWERTNKVRWLVGAVLALVVGLDMHSLAVAAVLMFLVPGLLTGDIRRLLYGAAAAFVVTLAFVLIDGLVNAQYPTPSSEFAASFPMPQRPSVAPAGFRTAVDLVLGALGVAAAFFAFRLRRNTQGRIASMGVLAMLVAGIGLQLALYYHLAAIFYTGGAVLAMRHRASIARRDAALLLATVVAILSIHIALLAPLAGTPVRLVGALVGQPSVWPDIKLAQLSPMAGVATGALLAWGVYRLAQRQRVADFWLLALLGVWAPVFALGLFAWDVPSRYTAMSLAPMLLCAFAAAQRCVDTFAAEPSQDQPYARWKSLAAAMMASCVVNPAMVAASVNTGYSTHPDHKGAAEFMRTQHVTEDDIVLAEDVLQQTYYLGHVDYWLIGPQVARKFVKPTEAGVVDFYTGTPVIVSTAALDQLLQENRHRRVFVIGAGEGWSRGVRGVRQELQAAIESDRFTTLYLGRDRLTRVLLAVPARSSHEVCSDGNLPRVSTDAAPAVCE